MSRVLLFQNIIVKTKDTNIIKNSINIIQDIIQDVNITCLSFKFI